MSGYDDDLDSMARDPTLSNLNISTLSTVAFGVLVAGMKDIATAVADGVDGGKVGRVGIATAHGRMVSMAEVLELIRLAVFTVNANFSDCARLESKVSVDLDVIG